LAVVDMVVLAAGAVAAVVVLAAAEPRGAGDVIESFKTCMPTSLYFAAGFKKALS
jgi:hypothetical protein